ncbi:AtpZ/AtpI family protein [Pelagovum pacificum]|uniref:ATP synthase protein I n=1 Tax=Pelagovum pacificum TaxID=2588711 RepID=A0A5C5GHQ2_9RHOB|nr:AtpZ/AtpI family protein [Pelagovum pacificum]QQA43442.1 AtpZ/AtpI family protein [Pelagovum pacificum]TNY33421.1 AtpZ/AtpI family protein [Pelagovum pacificum]
MSEPDNADRLKALEERIRKAKGEPEVAHHSESHHSQAQLAWRMVTELVAGLGIGFGIGYGLDVLLGTGPWLMVLFIFLGLAAGVKVMLRSAQELQIRQLADRADEDGDG